MSSKIQIVLTKSLIGRLPKHKIIAGQLGLNKIGKSVVHNNTPEILGLVSKIDYLLTVKEL